MKSCLVLLAFFISLVYAQSSVSSIATSKPMSSMASIATASMSGAMPSAMSSVGLTKSILGPPTVSAMPTPSNKPPAAAPSARVTNVGKPASIGLNQVNFVKLEYTVAFSMILLLLFSVQ